MNEFLGWALVVTCVLLFALAGLTHAMAKDLLRMVDAGSELYRRARWVAPGVSLHEQAELWARFRDALHLPEGTATGLGVGDPNAK